MSHPLGKDLLDKYVPLVRARLVEAARKHRLVPYMEMANEFGGRGYFGQVLDALNRLEHAKGRPLISAIVVSKESRRPSFGFFVLAQQLGLFRSGSSRRGFWERERERVWAWPW